MRVQRGQRNIDVRVRSSRRWSGTIGTRQSQRALLKIFEKANEIHVADRDRLIKELKEGAKLRLGLQHIPDRSLGLHLEPKSRLRMPLRARAEGPGAHQPTKLRRVGQLVVGDIYLRWVRVGDSPVSTRL